MRSKRTLIGALVAVSVLTLTLLATDSAHAEPGVAVRPIRLEHRYLTYYWRVVRHHGRRAPGRNIVTRGFKTKRGNTRPPSRRELGRSVRTFKRWLAPPQAPIGRVDIAPYGQTAAYAGGLYAIPSGIVMCESGGNYRAVNNSNPNRPAGAYQIITSTWLGHGGGAYAPTADQATPAQQDEIARRVYAGGAGRGQWEC